MTAAAAAGSTSAGAGSGASPARPARDRCRPPAPATATVAVVSSQGRAGSRRTAKGAAAAVTTHRPSRPARPVARQPDAPAGRPRPAVPPRPRGRARSTARRGCAGRSRPWSGPRRGCRRLTGGSPTGPAWPPQPGRGWWPAPPGSPGPPPELGAALAAQGTAKPPALRGGQPAADTVVSFCRAVQRVSETGGRDRAAGTDTLGPLAAPARQREEPLRVDPGSRAGCPLPPAGRGGGEHGGHRSALPSRVDRTGPAVAL